VNPAPRATEVTSCESYREIEPTLAERERAVLLGLERYRHGHRDWPTAYELFEFMKTAAIGRVHDLNDVRPRLTALKQRPHPLVFNGAVKRKCLVTGKAALTWELPPLKLF
jgi:hypothetical protein